MATVNDIIDMVKRELEEDAKLPPHDTHKLTRDDRTKLLNQLVRLQNSRKTHVKTTKNGVSRNGIKMGRPRRDLNPESQGKEFIRTLEKVVGNERKESTEEGQLEAGVEAGPRHEQVA